MKTTKKQVTSKLDDETLTITISDILNTSRHLVRLSTMCNIKQVNILIGEPCNLYFIVEPKENVKHQTIITLYRMKCYNTDDTTINFEGYIHTKDLNVKILMFVPYVNLDF